MINAAVLLQVVLDSRDGITISDPNLPDNPLVFINNAFTKMTGYSREEVFSHNCRFLQGVDKKQRHMEVLQDSIKNSKRCLVTLKNYHKNGTLFWNELSISPVFDESGKVIHFIGIQKDVTARVQLEQLLRKELKHTQESKAILEKLVIRDDKTGIYNRDYFGNLLNGIWPALEERGASATLMMIGIDHFKTYIDTYGDMAGDLALKRIATTLAAAMKRDTDIIAHYDTSKFVIFASDMTVRQAASYAQALCDTIRNLNISHEYASEKVLTISCGIAHIGSISQGSPNVLIQQAEKALEKSESLGGGQAIVFERL
jgi:diguanylate cyclase (GGDEF)-like protein/PAS domain S-box-containing protein